MTRLPADGTLPAAAAAAGPPSPQLAPPRENTEATLVPSRNRLTTVPGREEQEQKEKMLACSPPGAKRQDSKRQLSQLRVSRRQQVLSLSREKERKEK